MSDDAAWRLVSSTAVVESTWLRVLRNEYVTRSGREMRDYYVVERSPFVLIVAEVDDRVILIRQYRPATDRTYWGLPAGFLDPNETPLEAALRELLEETGHEGSEAKLVGELDPLPGYIRSTAHVVRMKARRAGQRIDQDEVDEVKLVPRGDVLAMIQDGEIREMQAVAALLLVWQKER